MSKYFSATLVVPCVLALCTAVPGTSAEISDTQTVPAGDGVSDSSGQTGVVLEDSASPFGVMKLSEEEIAKLQMPQLDGAVTPDDEASFDKYYYFHRADTDVSVAYDDIGECDGYARGLAVGYRYVNSYNYTTAGIVGGAVGNMLAAAIFGSAEKRKARRVNMRACMSFKGYQRFGLPKPLWEKFNFEEGLDGVSDETRKMLLGQQALVAARSNPGGKVLEP